MSSATSTSPPPPPSPSKLKQAGMQVASGGSAGFVEVLLMHPLDLVKTRLQLQTSKQPTAAATIGGNGAVKPPVRIFFFFNFMLVYWWWFICSYIAACCLLQWNVWLYGKNVSSRRRPFVLERHRSAHIGRNPEACHKVPMLRTVQTFVSLWFR